MTANDANGRPPAPTPQANGTGPVRLRLGTRRSALATTQSRTIADLVTIEAALAGIPVEVELVEVTTHGDVSAAPLTSLGGAGVFVSALRGALLNDEVDIAVHSLKDLPTVPQDGLLLAAVPEREDPRDALIARDGLTLAELPPGSKVGTGSPRRAGQLRALGLGLEVVDIRGNVDTRIGYVRNGTLDAVVLAWAGLLRLGRGDEATEVLDPLLMLPAPGQGALAVECREGDERVLPFLRRIDDPFTRAAVAAERELLSTLEAGCHAPVGALGEVVEGEDGPELSLRAMVARLDGSIMIRRSATLPISKAPPDPGTFAPLASFPVIGGLPGTSPAAAPALGRALAEQLLADGVAHLMPVPASATRARETIQAREGDL